MSTTELAPMALGVEIAACLAADEVTDFVIANRHVRKGDAHAAVWVPHSHPVGFGGGFYLGASRRYGIVMPNGPDLRALGGVITPEQILRRGKRLRALLGGRKRLKDVLDPTEDGHVNAFLGVTRRGEEIVEVRLLHSDFGPLAAKHFMAKTHLDEPIDVVWRPDFGVELEVALDAVREATLAVPRPKKKIREAYRYHPLERGSVLATLHGTPVEWARSFLEGAPR